MIKIHRAKWVFDAPYAHELRHIENGAVAFDETGMLVATGAFREVRKLFPKAKMIDHGANAVITPGFIDCHVHAPQMEMMAAAGYSLLEWLNNYTFPTEAKYESRSYAKKRWKEFCEALLCCGTTYAAIYATVHTAATVELLKACDKAGLRAHVGKVLMDRNAPENLLQDADEALTELQGLVSLWKKNARVKPSLCIRFAPTSSEKLLRGAGEFARKNSDLIVQTHLAETLEEVRWVKELFPSNRNYTDVYAEQGLISEKSVLGHCIYLNDDEIQTHKNNRSHLVHCPSSNFFLGSGLFPYRKLVDGGCSVALGSDVGAGWDLSLQSTARCCYEAQALQKTFLKPSELLYLITRSGAIALGHEHDLGVFETGYRADFVVHNLKGRHLVYDRAQRSESCEELLSALLFLGGESTVAETYVDGRLVFKNRNS